MKSLSPIIVSLALVAVTSGVMAAEEKELTQKQIPQAVDAAFQKTYPNAKQVKYQEEITDGMITYEIEFKENGKELEASYTAKGALIETEEEIKTSQLPVPIVQAVKKAYPKATLKGAEKTMKPDGAISGYEVDITEGKKALELDLDASGKILKAEADKEANGE